ncbi:hypothetical protein RUM43_001348 [Polyplax serrata]|uniref:Selenocysteine lyase n=1 Tax=Polyplax serrata TaxID=468196 RepID=A0AAN8XTR4_POLSC
MDIFNRKSNLIYLDHNATTPLAQEVIKGISESLITDWGNPSSFHPFGARAKSMVNRARKQVAEMVHCSPTDVIFTSGGTEANNMVMYNAVRDFQHYRRFGSSNKFGEKPHIITSNVEHDSVILPIRHLEEQYSVTFSIVKVTPSGTLNVEDVLSKITDQTCLISVMFANNETGVIMPIANIGKELLEINAERKKKHLKEILFHTDAAQMIGKEPVDFSSLNCHFMTIVGHKFYGPRIGCLIAKTKLYPIFFGGGQENGLRPGTENTPMIVGLGIAAELVSKNLSTHRQHLLECRKALEKKLREAFGEEVVINCEKSNRLSNTTNVSFKGTGLEGNLVLSRCENLIASVGAACHAGQCSQILINSGVPLALAKNAIRLSVGRDTTLTDIEDVVSDLKTAVNKLKANIRC